MRRLFLCLFFSVSLPAGAAELWLFAAVSTSEVVAPLAKAHEERTGVHVVLSLGSSSDLARQIAAGARADLFLSADEVEIERLVKAGRVRAGSAKVVARNQLAVVLAPHVRVQVDGPRSLAALRRIALADPQTVPAGRYARQWLQSQGVWETAAPKVIPAIDVRAALAAVEAGHADAAVVYRTDAKVAKRAKLAFTVAPDVGPPIAYFLVAIEGARGGTPQLADLLLSREAQGSFERGGFLPPGGR